MDPADCIVVRFHFNGEFINDGKTVQYVGGKEAMSFLDRATLSLQRIQQCLSEHYVTVDGQQLHWLFPGKDLFDGLLMLSEDKSVETLSACTTDAGVADVYVEDPAMQDEEVSEEEDWAEDEYVATADEKKSAKEKPIDVESSSDDSDFVPPDCSSDDDEADAIRQDYKKFKKSKKMAAEKLALEYEFEALNVVKPEGNYEDDSSAEEDESYDEDSDGELIKRESEYARFNSKAEVIKFTLGMTFSGKKEFKDAIIRYALKERKEIKFLKDEGVRVRAKCTWPHCPWVCLLRKTSKFESWQITSFTEEHTCPKRKDSALVTSRRIAEKFESLIMSSPEWSIQQLKSTIQEKMFANVSISKIKRAKALVIGKMLAAKEGEYNQVFDYQLELLRSNPGTTCVVKLHPDFEEPTFHHFYVCFDACKKGFFAKRNIECCSPLGSNGRA